MASSRDPSRPRSSRQPAEGQGLASDEGVERALADMASVFDDMTRAIARADDATTKIEPRAAPRTPKPPTMRDRFDARVADVREQIRALRARPGARPAGNRGAADALAATRAGVRAELEQFERVVEELSSQADLETAHRDRWRRRAELAVLAEDDDLARRALARGKEHEAQARALRAEIELATRVMAELRAALASTDPDAQA